MAALWMRMLRLGKLRYLITGAALALLFGLICRGLSSIFRPLSLWQRFRGTLLTAVQQNSQTILTVSFTDSRRMQHTTAFPAQTDRPPQPGEAVRFAMDRALFISGSYPQNASDAAEAEGKILLHAPYRRRLAKEIAQRLAVWLVIWLIAALICFAAVKLCFPA